MRKIIRNNPCRNVTFQQLYSIKKEVICIQTNACIKKLSVFYHDKYLTQDAKARSDSLNGRFVIIIYFLYD